MRDKLRILGLSALLVANPTDAPKSYQLVQERDTSVSRPTSQPTSRNTEIAYDRAVTDQSIRQAYLNQEMAKVRSLIERADKPLRLDSIIYDPTGEFMTDYILEHLPEEANPDSTETYEAVLDLTKKSKARCKTPFFINLFGEKKSSKAYVFSRFFDKSQMSEEEVLPEILQAVIESNQIYDGKIGLKSISGAKLFELQSTGRINESNFSRIRGIEVDVLLLNIIEKTGIGKEPITTNIKKRTKKRIDDLSNLDLRDEEREFFEELKRAYGERINYILN